MSDRPRNCKVCGCLFNVPSAKISIEHCIMKELNTTAFLCVDCASKLIKWLQDNSIDPRLISEVNSNIENEEHGKKTFYALADENLVMRKIVLSEKGLCIVKELLGKEHDLIQVNSNKEHYTMFPDLETAKAVINVLSSPLKIIRITQTMQPLT